MVKLLISAGANVNAQNSRRGGQQPIHLTGMFGNESLLRVLLEHGAQMECRTTSNGAQSVLELAARLVIARVEQLSW